MDESASRKQGQAESAKNQKLIVRLLKREAIHLKYAFYPPTLDKHFAGDKYLNKTQTDLVNYMC